MCIFKINYLLYCFVQAEFVSIFLLMFAAHMELQVTAEKYCNHVTYQLSI